MQAKDMELVLTFKSNLENKSSSNSMPFIWKTKNKVGFFVCLFFLDTYSGI